MGLKGYSNEYVAPEIIQSKNTLNNLNFTQINPWKAQIYSLGIIILKLIGSFKKTKIDLKIDDFKKSAQEHSKILDWLNGYNDQLTDKLSKNIITICEKCIEYDPINRPSSSDLSDLLKDLTTKNSNTINEEYKKKLQNESIKTCKDQSTKVSNENNKELNEQKALNNSNSKTIDELKNQIQLIQKENSRIKSDNQELTQQNKLSEEKVRKAKDCLERIKTIESDNNELKHLLEDPEILLKHLISKIGMESNTKTDVENISKFLNNLINKKRYPYRLFLVDESKMKINTLMNPNLFIDNSKKFLNIQVKFEYTFANPLDKLTLKSFVDFFYNLGFLKNQNIITVEKLKDNLDFGQIEAKMKEFYSKKMEILQKEIYTKFKANIIENSRAPKHFIGELKYGAPQNLGNLIYENGTIYQTKFSDGKIDNYCLISKGYKLYLGFFDPISFSGFGCCLIIDPDKISRKEHMDLHFGYFDNLIPEGYGIKKIVKGTFTGNWSRGLHSGNNVAFIYNDEKSLKYEWKLDQIIGEGTFESSNKEGSYKGTFENGGFKYGEYTYSDGTSYYGEWKEFKRNGYGKLSYKDNEKDYYEGYFLNDKQHGNGETRYKDKSYYKGEYKNDELNGQAEFHNPNCYLEEKGVYKNGKLNGEGTKKYTNINQIYTGSFKDGKFDGKGKLENPGEYYIGEFKNNQKHGQGKKVETIFKKNENPETIITEGEWEKDKFIIN